MSWEKTTPAFILGAAAAFQLGAAGLAQGSPTLQTFIEEFNAGLLDLFVSQGKKKAKQPEAKPECPDSQTQPCKK